MWKLNEKIIKDIVTIFLSEVKKLVEKGQIEFNTEYEKNISTMKILRRKYGITHNDVLDELRCKILELTLQDYISGPDEDKKPERGYYFWKFKTDLFNSDEIYLKLVKNENKVIGWSFHYPEYKLNCPFS